MKDHAPLRSRVVRVALLLGVVAMLLVPSWRLPPGVGTVDFRPYWSSAYLLARGRDFADPSAMDFVERSLAGWREPYTMSAWFAPTGNLILLPYVVFPFARAAYYWLLTNIAAILLSCIVLWHGPKGSVWIPVVAAFGFSMTLVSLMVGQVNTLELLGLALFMRYSDGRKEIGAGVSLALTTIKPHIVVLTLPLLLLDITWRRQWRVLAGFLGAIVGSAALLSVLYPLWPVSFSKLLASGFQTVRETPTISGLLVLVGETHWGRFLWIPILSFAGAIWWRNRKVLERRALVDISILAGLVVAPFGWSYDQVMLLLPISSVLEWASDRSLSRKDAAVAVICLLLTNAATFYLRILSPSEVWFFWVPLAVAGVYAFSWSRARVNAPDSGTLPR